MDSTSGLTEFDIAVLIIVLLSSVFATLRGFIKELLVLVSWIGSAAITIYSFPYAADFMGDWFQDSKVVNIIAIILVFLGILTLISIVNAMILDNLREMRLGMIDRSTGLLFGLVRGVLIASVIHFAIIILHQDDEGPDWLTGSETYQITKVGSDIIKELSEEYRESNFADKTDEFIDGENPEALKEAVEDIDDDGYVGDYDEEF